MKLSRDPNNTAWSKSTDGFGHKILSQQGWTAGSFLGANNAAQAEHYTAANASHIRVALREDNLGLGAKIGAKANAETFGLATLSGIFGRLNGKTEEVVEKQQGALRDAELRSWQAQKFGFMNFVRGGLLVGDKIEDLVQEVPIAEKTGDATSVVVKADSKKRKHGDEVEPEDTTAEQAKRAKTSSKASKSAAASSSPKSKPTEAEEEKDDDSDSAARTTTETKEERRRRRALRREERAAKSVKKSSASDVKARLKDEKRARKEDRRKRREQKGQRAADAETTTADITSASSSGTATPVIVDTPTYGHRHAIRQRYIMQKRMATMDQKAMNEILMIKTPVS